jgi:hypothetical protein
MVKCYTNHNGNWIRGSFNHDATRGNSYNMFGGNEVYNKLELCQELRGGDTYCPRSLRGQYPSDCKGSPIRKCINSGTDDYESELRKWFGSSNENHIKNVMNSGGIRNQRQILPYVSQNSNHVSYAYIPPYGEFSFFTENKKNRYDLDDASVKCSGKKFRGLTVREKDRNKTHSNGTHRPVAFNFGGGWQNRCKGFGLDTYADPNYPLYGGAHWRGYNWKTTPIYAPFVTCRLSRNKAKEVNFTEMEAAKTTGDLPSAFPINDLKFDYCSYNTDRLKTPVCYEFANEVHMNADKYPQYKAHFSDNMTNRIEWSKAYCGHDDGSRILGDKKNHPVCEQICDTNKSECLRIRQKACQSKYNSLKDDPEALETWLNDPNNLCGCYLDDDEVYKPYAEAMIEKMGLKDATTTASEIIKSNIMSQRQCLYPACARNVASYRVGAGCAENIVICNQSTTVSAESGSSISVGRDFDASNTMDCMVEVNQNSEECQGKFINIWQEGVMDINGEWKEGECFQYTSDMPQIEGLEVGKHYIMKIRPLKSQFSDDTTCIVPVEYHLLEKTDLDVCLNTLNPSSPDDDVEDPDDDEEDPDDDVEDPNDDVEDPDDDEEDPDDDVEDPNDDVEDPDDDVEDPDDDVEDPDDDEEDPDDDVEDPDDDVEDPDDDEEDPDDDENGLSTGAIVGIVIGVVIVLLLIIAFIMMMSEYTPVTKPLTGVLP